MNMTEMIKQLGALQKCPCPQNRIGRSSMTEHIQVFEREPHPTTIFTRTVIKALELGIIDEEQLLALDRIRQELKNDN